MKSPGRHKRCIVDPSAQWGKFRGGLSGLGEDDSVSSIAFNNDHRWSCTLTRVAGGLSVVGVDLNSDHAPSACMEGLQDCTANAAATAGYDDAALIRIHAVRPLVAAPENVLSTTPNPTPLPSLILLDW